MFACLSESELHTNGGRLYQQNTAGVGAMGSEDSRISRRARTMHRLKNRRMTTGTIEQGSTDAVDNAFNSHKGRTPFSINTHFLQCSCVGAASAPRGEAMFCPPLTVGKDSSSGWAEQLKSVKFRSLLSSEVPGLAYNDFNFTMAIAQLTQLSLNTSPVCCCGLFSSPLVTDHLSTRFEGCWRGDFDGLVISLV